MNRPDTTDKTNGNIKPDWRSRACITLREAAEILSCPPSQLRKLCRQGQLNPITGLGRKWRLDTKDIEAMLARRLRN